MIYSIKSSSESFSDISLEPGFNAIVAERSDRETSTSSRNGLGKTSIIHILHYCLGGGRKDSLEKEVLDNWSFSVDIDIGKTKVEVNRSMTNGDISVKGKWDNLPLDPNDKDRDRAIYSEARWKRLLGKAFFGLSESTHAESYAPTFRSLIPYFMRRGVDAFTSPFKYFSTQRSYQKQVYNSYLLGLNWKKAKELHELNQDIDDLEQLQDASETDLFEELMGSVGALETKKVQLEDDIDKLESKLDSFEVHPEYSEIEEEVNTLTEKIHQLSNENVRDRRLVDMYEQTLEQEESADHDDIAEVYEKTGAELNIDIDKKLSEVKAFHKKVVSNRETYLQNEIERLKKQIEERESKKDDLDEERAGKMRILKSKGALEEYTELQNELNELKTKYQQVADRIQTLKQINKELSNLSMKKEELISEARQDLEERNYQKKQAISTFNEYSQELYGVSGNLVIEFDKNGYKFDIDIEREDSDGVSKMEVFCYDLMLAKLWSQKTNSPGFLIHDSTIFSDVDERQFAKALKLAKNQAEEHGFQYICMLNSDKIPGDELDGELDISKYTRLSLNDEEASNTLFGVHF